MRVDDACHFGIVKHSSPPPPVDPSEKPQGPASNLAFLKGGVGSKQVVCSWEREFYKLRPITPEAKTPRGASAVAYYGFLRGAVFHMGGESSG